MHPIKHTDAVTSYENHICQRQTSHGSALVGSDPHELTPEFEICQMKGTHIGISELTLFKSCEIGLLKI